ncbi:hypothetical protein ACFL4N_03690 [Thermodesulfobacteriota bacterium]
MIHIFQETPFFSSALPSSMCRKLAIVFIALFLSTSCSPQHHTETWRAQYRYLEQPVPQGPFTESNYYAVFLVAASHLDYDDNKELFESLARHNNAFKKGQVGHSWVYLKGQRDGKTVIFHGGHSVRSGEARPWYFDGVIDYIEYGYLNPTDHQKKNPRYEANPVKYLWAELDVGYFQKGSGWRKPTYAAKVDLSKEQFEEIFAFTDPKVYPYKYFSLVNKQCSSLLAQVASMAGLALEHQVTVEIAPVFQAGSREYRLWADPQYSKITFSSPDIIERSLMNAVREGKAQYALDWYRNR